MSDDFEIGGACGCELQIRGQRRRANALNVEIGSPQKRCTQKPPPSPSKNPNRSSALVYLLSGNESPYHWGVCTPRMCPNDSAIAPPSFEA